MLELLQAIRDYGEACHDSGERTTRQETAAARKVLRLILKRRPRPATQVPDPGQSDDRGPQEERSEARE